MAKSLCRLALDTALSCLCVVMETESSMSAEQRGGAGAQTDMIGVFWFTAKGFLYGSMKLSELIYDLIKITEDYC